MFPCGIVNSQIKPYRFKCTHTSHPMDVTFVSLFRRYFMFIWQWVFLPNLLWFMCILYTVVGSCSTATCFSQGFCFIHVFFLRTPVVLPGTVHTMSSWRLRQSSTVCRYCHLQRVDGVWSASHFQREGAEKHVSARKPMIYVLGSKHWTFIVHSAYLVVEGETCAMNHNDII